VPTVVGRAGTDCPDGGVVVDGVAGAEKGEATGASADSGVSGKLELIR